MSFIKTDIQILEKNFEVIHDYHLWKNKKAIPLYFLKQAYKIFRHRNEVSHILVSFARYLSIVPVILGKLLNIKVSVILHGSECADFKEINYGVINKPILKHALKYTFKYAYTLLPVSESLVYTENNYFFRDRIIKQGYKYFYPNIRTPFKIIFNGIDTQKWKNINHIPKVKNQFITVLSEGQFLRKGCDLIIEIASQFPDCKFFIVGLNAPANISIPTNIQFYKYQPPSELLKLYSSSRFYFQLSNFEGFGVALIEAMACECIPIVSNINMMPEIIGDSGFVLKYRDVDELNNLIETALKKEDLDNLGKKARERVDSNYNINLREKELVDYLNSN